MRDKLFQWIAIVVVIGAVLYALFVFIKSMYHWWQDARTTRSLNEMATSFDDKRRADRKAAADRLNNGCEHDYEDLLNAFLPDVCVKCGIAKKRPTGDCDHVWRRISGPIPGSQCEACGEKYGAAASQE